MRRPALIPALLVVALVAAPAVADTVYLENGRSFEEVIAETVGDSVRIRLPYGEIVLPAKAVARVERAPSVWQLYLERERELRSAGSPASDWLELARWSQGHGFVRGLQTAALVAARLEPGLEGLQPLMAAMGYSFDSKAGEWLTESERMRRRGYVPWEGRWVTPEVRQFEMRQLEALAAQRREELRQERIARAIEALAVAQLSRSKQEAEEPPRRAPAAGGSPLVAVFPGYFPFLVANPRAVGAGGTAAAPAASHPDAASFDDLIDRQPGSLFPVAPRRRHLRSSDGPAPGASPERGTSAPG